MLPAFAADGPCWPVDSPSMFRGVKMTLELRSWSAVKSVQS